MQEFGPKLLTFQCYQIYTHASDVSYCSPLIQIVITGAVTTCSQQQPMLQFISWHCTTDWRHWDNEANELDTDIDPSVINQQI